MAVSNYVLYSGRSNSGIQSNKNEDYIVFREYDDILFSAIADGSGSKDSDANPAAIAAMQTADIIGRICKKDKGLLLSNAKLLMEEAMLSANNILIGYKLGNEEKYYGFATTLTALLLQPNGTLTFGHAGNSRIYLIRDGELRQLTKDHTKGQQLVDAGYMTEEDYYVSLERLSLYNGLGILPTPSIQSFEFPLKPGEVVVMTPDGVHYSLRPEAIYNIIASSDNVDEACENIVKTVLDLKNYRDNISVNILWYLGEKPEKEGKE